MAYSTLNFERDIHLYKEPKLQELLKTHPLEEALERFLLDQANALIDIFGTDVFLFLGRNNKEMDYYKLYAFAFDANESYSLSSRLIRPSLVWESHVKDGIIFTNFLHLSRRKLTIKSVSIPFSTDLEIKVTNDDYLEEEMLKLCTKHQLANVHFFVRSFYDNRTITFTFNQQPRDESLKREIIIPYGYRMKDVNHLHWKMIQRLE